MIVFTLLFRLSTVYKIMCAVSIIFQCLDMQNYLQIKNHTLHDSDNNNNNNINNNLLIFYNVKNVK